MMGSGMCRHFGQRSRRPPKTCRPQKESPGRAEANELNRGGRKRYLPLGGRPFWSRRAYEPPNETKFDRANRRARKLRLRLGGDPADDEYPDKPLRMRWATYNRTDLARLMPLRMNGSRRPGP